jgi:hypothetical protein
MNLIRAYSSKAPKVFQSIQRLFSVQGGALTTGNELNQPSSSITRERIIRTDNLTPFQEFCVNGGVERAFTGDKWYEREVGTYHCVVCNSELFR